ncbi:MAG TPA: hypothetical protein VGP07_25000 [Polyangia bacterium]|jgi:hypothetical protein
MLPRPTIEAFDRHLTGLGLGFEGVVIGGSALGLMGIIRRPTRDFDILVPDLPPMIASAASEFAKVQRQAGVDLVDDWLNNGPKQLGDVLPAGWPSSAELDECLPWLEQQDGSEQWPAHVRATLADLAGRVGHGV